MNRLKELRTSKNLTREDLAKILNVTSMTVYRYETESRQINNKALQKLSDYFDVTYDYILGKDLPEIENVPKIQTAKIPPEYHKIPIVGSVACSWDKGFIEDFDGEYSYINDYLYDKYGDMVRATTARGNSMKEMINPGDLLIVVPATDIENDDIVIAMVGDDELTAKKFHYNDVGGFDLIPVNPSYGKQSFTKDEIMKLPVKVVARVVEIRKELRA